MDKYLRKLSVEIWWGTFYLLSKGTEDIEVSPFLSHHPEERKNNLKPKFPKTIIILTCLHPPLIS